MNRHASLSTVAAAALSLAAPALLWLGPTTQADQAGQAPPRSTTSGDAGVDAASRSTAGIQGAVLLHGDVRRPTLLTTRTLQRFDQQTVTATYTSAGRPTTRTFTGPLLLDVAQSARPRFDEAQSNDQLAFAVRVGATDGYRAVVAWGEIDPGFAGTQVLLALTEDGRKLDRPRLVVPGDARGGRYVSDVVTVRVVDLGR